MISLHEHDPGRPKLIATFNPDRELQEKTTFCRICTGLCGIKVTTDGEKIASIEPDRNHPYTWRDFCSKGRNAENVRSDPRRITRPMKRVGDKYIESSYEEAFADIGRRLKIIRDEHSPHAIAAYLGNPAALNSAGTMMHNMFMQSIGSANSYYVGSIDQNNLHLVADRMFGSELAVLIPDIDHADCILLIGANPAVSLMSWVETTRNGWRRILARKSEGLDLIVVDPHKTRTTRQATSHVQVTPGEDWALLLGLIKVIFENQWEHEQDCGEARDIEVLRGVASRASLDDLSMRCSVSADDIRDIARRFSQAKTGFCVTRTGVSQNRNGTLGEWLGHVLNLICGRIDRKGGRYYQPGIFKNSMKVLNSMSRVQKRLSRIGGYKAVVGAYPLSILADEITTPGEEQIRALIINSGNPVISGPQGTKLDEALEQLDLLVAIDFFQRESHRHADWILPGRHYLEREDLFALMGVVFEKPFTQLSRPVVKAPDNMPDEWEYFIEFALAMRVPFLGLPGMNSVIRLSRWFSRKTGNPLHAFNPRWIWAGLIKLFGVVKWKEIVNAKNGLYYRNFEIGQFRPSLQTEDGKIQAAPAEFVEILKSRLSERFQPDDLYPYRLINQRRLSMMNSWLTESNYQQFDYGDFVEMNTEDAIATNINDWDKVRVSSGVGSIEATVRITHDVPPGTVSMDHGWGSRLFDPKGESKPEVRGVNRNLLVSGQKQDIDELSGIPSFNGTKVTIQSLACEAGESA